MSTRLSPRRAAGVLLAALTLALGAFVPNAEASHLRGALGSAVYDPAAKTVTLRTQLLQRKNFGSYTFFAFPTIMRVDRTTGAMTAVTRCTGQNTTGTQTTDTSSQPLFDIDTSVYVVDVSCVAFSTKFDYLFSQTGNNRIAGIKNSSNLTIEVETKVRIDGTTAVSAPVFNSGYMTNVPYDPTATFSTNLNASTFDGKAVTYSLVTNQSSVVGGYGAGRIPCSALNTSSGSFTIASSLCTGTETYATAFGGGTDAAPIYYALKVQATDSIGQTMTRDVLLAFSSTTNRAPVFSAGSSQTVSVAAGATRDITVSATDPDGNTVNYATDGLPSWATFTPGTPSVTTNGTLHLAPPAGTNTTARITLSAYDNATYPLSTSLQYDVQVGSSVLPPSAPTITSVTAGNTQLSIAFAAPVGGGTVDSYALTVTPVNGSTPITVACAAPPTACVVTGLTNNITYTVAVTATNTEGTATSATASGTPSGPKAPTIVVNPSTVSVLQNHAYASTVLTITNSGDAATSWSINPSAPAGLTFNTSTGALTGTPTTLQAAVRYTITATNSLGSSSATVDLSIITSAQTISFTQPWGMKKWSGTSTQNLTATSTSGGTVAFSIAAGSTAGCAIANSNQVQITSSSATGTCTVAANQAGGNGWDAAPTVYKTFMVFTTGSTTSGSCSTSTSRIYSTAPILYLTNSTVTYQMTSPSTSYTSSSSPYSIINAGAPGASFTSGVPTGCTISTTSPYGFKVSPTGPTGLTFGGSNGLFTGTPTAKQGYSVYSITATIRSSTGTYTSTAVALNARVLGVSQTITFNSLADKVVGVAPFTLSATASSALTVTFASSTTSVCTVSGTTVTILAAGTCTITASQAGNTSYEAATAVSRSFTVTSKPIISVSPSSATFDVDTPIGTPYAITNTGGVATSYAISPAVPDGMSFDTTTGLLAGAPEVGQSATPYSITATNSVGTSNPVTFTISVNKASQSITFDQFHGMVVGDTQTVSATTSSGLATVNTVDTPTVCHVVGPTLVADTAGVCKVTASQPGNASYLSATSVQRSVTVANVLLAPSLVIDNTSASFYVNLPLFSPYNIVNVGGNATSFSISPSLPTDFTFDPASGSIVDGTPATVGSTLYAITATNAAGTSSPVYFTLDVTKRSQSISFPSLSQMFLSSADQAPGATATSGLTVAYGIDPASTGVCSIVAGKVHALAGGTCTVTADQAGNGDFLAAGTMSQSFTVLTVPAIAVSPTTVTLTAGLSTSSPYTVSNTGGAATFFSVSPALPTGVSLDSSTGTINGTPAAYAATTTYSLTAQNAAGTGNTTTFNLAVQKQNQTITFPALNAAVLTDATTTTQTLAASAGSGLPISYSVASASSSVCSLSGDTVTALAAGTCTVNANQAGDTVYGAATQTSRSFTVYAGLVAPNISLSASQGTYTFGIDVGTPYTVSNAGGPAASYGISPAIGAGLTFDTTTGEISGAPTGTLAATTYTVTATNASGSSSATFQVTVQKANASISLGNLSATYTGSPIAATATTTPAGLTVALTYDGSSTAPTAAGTYTVQATISNANYQATTTDTMVIAKATATVTLTNLTRAYTGAALSPTATTSPVGLTVALTYDGSSTSPVRSGSYTVQATVNNANYTGSASGTFTITAVTPSAPTLNSLTATDASIAVDFTAAADGGANIADYEYSLDGGTWTSSGSVSSPLTIGGLSNGVTYTVRLRAVTSAGASAASNSLSAMPFAAPALSALSASSVSYAAATVNATVAANGSSTVVEVTWSTDPLLVAGTTVVTAAQSPVPATATTATTSSLTGLPSNTRVYYMVSATNSAGTTDSTISSFVTAAPPPGAPAISVSPASGLFTFGVDVGVPYAITSTGGSITSYSISPAVPAGLSFDTATGVLSGTPTAVTSAVTYTITAHNTSGDSNASFRFGVGQAVASISLGNLTPTYTGLTQQVGVTTSPAGLSYDITYDGGSTLPTAAGSYAVAVTITDPSYYGMATATMVVGKATATVTFTVLNATYDGTPLTAGYTTSPAGLAATLTFDGQTSAPTNAGDYTVVATIDDPNFVGDATDTFTIDPATATVSLSDLNPTYDGTAKTVTVLTTPSGLSVATLYNGVTTAPTDTGVYPVITRITNPNYTGSTSGWLHISPASVTITLDNLNPTYDGTRHMVGATTTPAGISVAITYDGSSTAPLAAGAHSVHAEVTDPNYTGMVDGTLTIAKAPAGLVLGDLTSTYDGLPHQVSYTTTPAGLTVTVTYDGSPTPPSAQGSYTVVATVVDNNYTATVTNTMVIANALATVTISNLSATYDGATHAVSVVTDPVGLAVDVTYNGSSTPPTDAGSYTVVATVNDPNFAGTATSTLVIDKAVATITLGALSATYDGTAHSVSTSPASLAVDITYNGSPTAPTHAGSYTVVANVNDTNYVGTTIDTLVIDKAVATVTLGALSATYDGTAHSVSTTTFPSGLAADITYNGGATAPTDAGTYTVVATINDRDYTGTTTDSLVIDKAPVTVTLADLNHVFDGLAHSVTASTSPAALTVDIAYNGSSTQPVAAGTYDVVATVNDPNYAGTASAQMVIGTAAGTATIVLGGLDATYDTTSHAVTTASTPSGLTTTVTYNGSLNPPVDAGTYTVFATIDQVVGGIRYTGTASAQLVVAKAVATVNLSSLAATFNGQAHAAVASTTPGSLTVDFTYDGSATAPVHAGSYTVVATVNDPNYVGTAIDTLTIAKATATVVFTGTSVTYTSTPQQPSTTTNPSGLTVTLTYNGSPTEPSDAGSYTVVATIVDGDYTGTGTTTFVVHKAATALTLGSTTATYDGTAHAVTVTSVPDGVTVTITYDGSTTAPTNAGVYDIAATVVDANRDGSATGTLVISPADASVTVSNLDPVYDGLQHPAQVTTTPASLATSVTYNGSTLAPFSPGSYTVVVTITNPNYRGSATVRYVMHQPATAPVLEGSVPPEATPGDGTAIDGSGNITPVAVNVTSTGNGSSVELTDGNITLDVNPVDPGALTMNPDGSQTLAVNHTVAVTGTGFDPYSLVQIWLFSTPRLLGTAIVGPDGTFLSYVAVPSNIAGGSHTLQVHGFDHHRTHRSLQVGLRVAAHHTAPLPETGSDSTNLAALALALVLLGGALHQLSRRRGRRLA